MLHGLPGERENNVSVVVVDRQAYVVVAVGGGTADSSPSRKAASGVRDKRFPFPELRSIPQRMPFLLQQLPLLTLKFLQFQNAKHAEIADHLELDLPAAVRVGEAGRREHVRVQVRVCGGDLHDRIESLLQRVVERDPKVRVRVDPGHRARHFDRE